jgi:AcrR family transcriptional regulator
MPADTEDPAGAPGGGRRGRLTAAERRAQVVECTLLLIGKHGVRGTTTSRIAAEVGVSEAALYRHFASREEIILAALDSLFDRIYDVIAKADHSDAIERLRQIGNTHIALVSSCPESFVSPFLGFVTAPPDLGLRELLSDKQLAATKALANIVELGKTQGSIRQELDSEQVAWELVGTYWTEDIACLMGLKQFADHNRTARTIEMILQSALVEPSDSARANP